MTRRSTMRGVEKTRRGPRGLTLVESMTVVAIMGIIATLAVPGIRAMVSAYSGKESANQMLFALRSGRDFAQKFNAVTQVRYDGSNIIVDRQAHTSDDLTKVISGGAWETYRTYAVGADVTIINAPDIYFCASPEGRYRWATADGPRVCAIGSVSQTVVQNNPTPPAVWEFKVRGQDHTITVSPELGNAKLRAGS